MAVFYFNLFLTVAYVGILWFIQVVYLPVLPYIDSAAREGFAEKRRMNFTMVTYPVMLFEAASTLFLFFLASQSKAYPLFAAATLLLLLLLIYTFMMRNKTFKEYDRSFDPAVHKKLLKQNLVITLGWTLRFLLLIASIVVSD